MQVMSTADNDCGATLALRQWILRSTINHCQLTVDCQLTVSSAYPHELSTMEFSVLLDILR